MKRLRPAVAVVFCCGASVASLAADQSLPDTVTGAFQTVVIDAQAAAAQATAAAKDALVKRTSTKKKNKDKEAATSDAKSGETAADAAKSGDKSAKSESTKADPSKDAAKKDTAKTPEAQKQAEPQKAAEPAKEKETAGDKKDTAADPNAKTDPSAKDAKDQKDAGKTPPVPTEWPVVDIELARARCTQLLKGVDAVTIPEPPFRTGECGAPAPVRVVSIGKNPEVSFAPPAVMTCDMVANLAKWIQKDVQPLARKHLGSEVIRLESMSDYSCRHAYGRVGNKLSEHGKANALDIRGFVTRKGQTAYVLAGWGQTRRDVLKEIAAAKAAAEKAEAVKVAAEKADKTRAEMAAAAAAEAPAAANAPIPRKTIVEGLPKEPAKKKGSSLALPAAVAKEGLAMAPTHLGGPKDAAAKSEDGKKRKGKDGTAKEDKTKSKGTAVAALPPAGAEDQPDVKAPPPKDATSRFLHEAHGAACRIFGTTLGPEANEAHRNHFHVDMAERKVRKICD